MFQTAAGVRIPFPEKLSEQYQQDGDTLTSNLSFEKLADFVRAFYAELDEPLFLAIHPDAVYAYNELVAARLEGRTADGGKA